MTLIRTATIPSGLSGEGWRGGLCGLRLDGGGALCGFVKGGVQLHEKRIRVSAKIPDANKAPNGVLHKIHTTYIDYL